MIIQSKLCLAFVITAALCFPNTVRAEECTGPASREAKALGLGEYTAGSGRVQKGFGSVEYQTRRDRLDAEITSKHTAALSAFKAKLREATKTIPAAAKEDAERATEELDHMVGNLEFTFSERKQKELDAFYEPKLEKLRKDFGVDRTTGEGATRETLVARNIHFDKVVRLGNAKNWYELYSSEGKIVAIKSVADRRTKLVQLDAQCKITRLEAKDEGVPESGMHLGAAFCADTKEADRLSKVTNATVFADRCEVSGGIHRGMQKDGGVCHCWNGREVTTKEKPGPRGICPSGTHSMSPIARIKDAALNTGASSLVNFQQAIAYCKVQEGNFAALPSTPVPGDVISGNRIKNTGEPVRR